ncbi:hypothetical protein [Nocardia aurea]|uniref:Outer membrane channel protein CpnT-like N-terminal domain-containing protein n=1 Tax=Nocardia aurea TaxID=2144174 RepID=A0ABV3FYK3_9NOCA
MTLYMPDGLQWLAWIAGTTWPEGDEDAAWAASRAWETASNELKAQLAGIDEARLATVAAYPQGEGGAAMGARYDVLRSGDQSVEALAELMQTISDSAFDMGTEIQATKLTVIVTLAWLALEILWAWLFPPTAPAVEAAAITTTRSFLKVFEDAVQKIITNIAARLGAPTVKRHFWTRAVQLRPVLPTAKGYGVYGARAIEAAAITGTINGAVQVGQLGAHKRRHFNGGEFGLSIFAGVAGMIPGREVGRYLGKGIDKVAGKNLDNVAGRVGRGVVIGGTSGAVGTGFGNVAAGAVTGDWSSFASGAGWVGGIARGGLVGGARGGFALGTAIPPGRGDIRSYVWMPKSSSGTTGHPPVTDGSSTSGSAGSSTHSGRTESGSSSGSGGTVYHDATSGPTSRAGASTGSGQTVYHDAASTISGSSSSSASGSSSSGSSSGSGSTTSGGGQSGHFTGRPPTSWESSVDGWGANGRPPPGNTGLVGGVPLPPAPVGTPPASTGSAPNGGAPRITGAPNTHGNPIAAGAGEPFLGEGKDVRGKPRPKEWPSIEPLPDAFTPPPGGAAQSSAWLPPAPSPGAEQHAAAAGPEDVDIPFTP